MIRKLLKDSQRLDGRNVHEYRNISIRLPKISMDNKAHSTCLLSLGKTQVLCKISCDVVEPKANHPSRGLIKLDVNTSFIKNNSNKLRDATEKALKLEPIIEKCLNKAVDLDSLCICAGERVFCINIEIKAQFDDGNLLDVIVLSALIGLKTFKRPDVTIGESGNITVHENLKDKDPVPLQIKTMPFFVTIGVLMESNQLILDLNKLEEDTLDSKIVVCLTPTNQLWCWHPLGSELWTNLSFNNRCFELVKSKVVALNCLISQAIKARQSSNETIIINSASYVPSHPVFVDENLEDNEPEKLIHEAPEILDGSDDMDIDSDTNEILDSAQNDDWSRIESLVSHTEKVVYQKS